MDNMLEVLKKHGNSGIPVIHEGKTGRIFADPAVSQICFIEQSQIAPFLEHKTFTAGTKRSLKKRYYVLSWKKDEEQYGFLRTFSGSMRNAKNSISGEAMDNLNQRTS